MLALVNTMQPQILGLHDILSEFVKHRQSVVRRCTEFRLKKAKARAHILEGYKIALDHIDEVIKTIRASKLRMRQRRTCVLSSDWAEIQAKAILAMQLRRLTGLEREAVENELRELLKLIARLEAILADEQEILNIIKAELLKWKRNMVMRGVVKLSTMRSK